MKYAIIGAIRFVLAIALFDGYAVRFVDRRIVFDGVSFRRCPA
jgi:hypothetical protein